MRDSALYLRISTVNQTLDSQIYRSKELAKQYNLNYVSTFKDEAVSGANPNRDGLDQLIEWIKINPGKIVVVPELSRLDRSDEQFTRVYLSALCKANRVELISDVPRTEDQAMNTLLDSIWSFKAAKERDDIKKRMVSGKRAKLKSGNPVVSKTPVGLLYIRREHDKPARIVINEYEADIIRKVFDMFVDQNYSISRIRDEIQAKGYKTRYGGGHWARCVIHRMLKNTAYTGDLVYGKRKYIHDGVRSQDAGPSDQSEMIHIKVPQIIDSEIFEKAQVKLKNNKFLNPRNSKYSYLLSKLLRCGKCKLAYTASNQLDKWFYYRCSSRANGRGAACGNRPVTAKDLEPKIWAWVKTLMVSPNILQKRFEKINKTTKKTISQLQDRIEVLKKRITNLDNKFNDMYDAYNLDKLTIDEFVLYKQKTENLRKDLLEDLKDNQNKLLNLYIIEDRAEENYNMRVKRYDLNPDLLDTMPQERKQQIIRNYIKEIVVLPQKDEYKIELTIPLEKPTIDFSLKSFNLRDRIANMFPTVIINTTPNYYYYTLIKQVNIRNSSNLFPL